MSVYQLHITKTDGTTETFNPVVSAADVLPAQSGQSGKFLTTNGTDASWGTVDALPSQTGHSGKFLTTDGSAASWATIDLDVIDCGDLPEVPKYTLTPSHFCSAGPNGWDVYGSDNTIKVLLHPTESITGTATIKILGKYEDQSLFKDKGLTFSNVKGSTAAGDLVAYDADGYMTLTLTFDGTNDVSKEIYIVSGDLAGIWHGSIAFAATSDNGDVNASIPEINTYI